MRTRYYIDPVTGQPHVYNHDVREAEVEAVLRHPGEDRPGRDGARIALGKTDFGRCLRVIYVPDPEPDSVFVITAFALTGKPLAVPEAMPTERKTMKKNAFPPGWNENRVREVLAHYEAQSEEEAVAEDETAVEDPSQTLMEVPNELVPTVRYLIAKKAS